MRLIFCSSEGDKTFKNDKYIVVAKETLPFVDEVLAK